MTTVLVFGYGSLLDQRDAERTVPNIEYVCNALLPGYRVACTRFSSTRGGGVADVIQDAESDVWGAVYRVDQAGLAALDCREGVGSSIYKRESMTALQNGEANSPMTVAVYTVVDKSVSPEPCTSEYLDLIVRGAENRHFPADYIRYLRTLPIR